MFDRKSISENGKAAFYACILEDLKKAAYDCGWALGLHGSLSHDMDIMAMPWTEDATSSDDMVMHLSDMCFGESPFHILCSKDEKPHNRVVYTIPIWEEIYLDISVINFGFN